MIIASASGRTYTFIMTTTSLKGSHPLTAFTPAHHTLLIVADGLSDPADIVEVVESAGYHALSARHTDALSILLAKAHPHLLIIVADEPEPDGLALCERIKAEDSFLPIVMITASDGADLRLAGMESGADAYLIRPIIGQELLVQIRSLLAIKLRFDGLAAANRQLNRDVEQRNNQLERALKSARDLDVIKGAIVRNVGHELRTPLLQVKAAVGLLDEETREGLPETDTTLRKLIDMATQATIRLESTVVNITQLAEIQNLGVEEVALNESVDLAIRNLERLWKSQVNNVKRIRKDYDEPLPLVRGHKRGIAQVLQHLLDNALKFSPDGGPVDVILRPRADGTVWIAVRDEGIGIAKREHKRIFEAFYQVDHSSTRKFNGVGVGLALVKLILDSLGTTTTVDSALGKGSTFSFCLPIYIADDAPPPEV